MSTSFILIIIAVAVVFLFIGIALGKSRARTGGQQMMASQTIRLPPQQFAAPVASRVTDTAGTERVLASLRSGNKIAAIRDYREMTNCGLREAKDAVEEMERNL